MSNVTYQMEYGRIFNELPYVGGISTMTNQEYEDASMSVEITYEDEKSSTFTGGFSLTAGVSASIEKATITVNYSATTTFEWANTKTTTTSVKAIGTAVVPARSIAVIEYGGTKGTCNIPFSYTRADKSSTDGQTTYTRQLLQLRLSYQISSRFNSTWIWTDRSSSLSLFSTLSLC